jgi:hypothetical protein
MDTFSSSLARYYSSCAIAMFGEVFILFHLTGACIAWPVPVAWISITGGRHSQTTIVFLSAAIAW